MKTTKMLAQGFVYSLLLSSLALPTFAAEGDAPAGSKTHADRVVSKSKKLEAAAGAVSDVQALYDAEVAKKGEVDAEIAALTEELEAAKAKLSSPSKMIKEKAQKAVDEYQAAIAEVQSAYDAKVAAAKQALEDAQAAADKAAKHKAAAERVEKETSALTAKIADAQQTAAQKEKLAEDLQAQVGSLTEQVKSTEADLAAANARNAELTQANLLLQQKLTMVIDAFTLARREANFAGQALKEKVEQLDGSDIFDSGSSAKKVRAAGKAAAEATPASKGKAAIRRAMSTGSLTSEAAGS